MSVIAATRFVAPEILSGRGVRSLVGRSAANLGARHVLLVTDPGVEAVGWASEAEAALAEAGVAHTVFDGVSPNPRARQVHAGAEAYAACGANAILAVGGGSPVDCAKGIGIIAANGGSILDYEGVDRIAAAIPPLLCVPTTAGAAADASQFAIITDEAAAMKIAIVSKTLVPDLTLLDPTVLATKPAALTAATGIDTLCHAVEAYVSTAASPFTDLLALEAIRTLVVQLPRCLAYPLDLAARAAMQQACLYAGLAFSNASLGAVHAMAHALGGRRDLPHGECNAILLPHVAAWNFETAPERHRRVGSALGLELDGLPDPEASARLRDGLSAFARSVGITATLGDAGVRPEHLAELARTALEDPCMATNPRIPTEAEIVDLRGRVMSRKPRFDDPASREALREKLAGLGEHSLRKSYYPELQARVAELERFRALLDQGSEAIFLLELPGATLVDVNESACQQLRVSRDRLLGRPLSGLLTPESELALSTAVKGDAGAIRSTISGRLRRVDGTEFPVEMSVRSVPLGKARHAVVVARDTTERDRLVAQLTLAERLASVGTLAAGVAHEVNNPLTFVVSNLDFIKRGVERLRILVEGVRREDRASLLALFEELDAAQADAAEGADRVRRIVLDLKVFSRADEGVRAPLDVRRVMDGALRLTANEIRHRARLVRQFGEVPLVLANEGRLSQVFTNLLINAAQSIPDGAADRNEITVSTWTEGDRAVVEVRDSGAGIPTEFLPRIFDPFFTTKPVGVGTGLGLSICHGIVTQLGGDIEATSALGTGTSFRVRLPGTDRAASAAAPEPSPPALPSTRILVIDDDPLSGASLVRLLSPPHRVMTTTSARAALDRIREGHAFDVILCDLMMPEMSGMDFYAALQAQAPEQARRVVFVTAGGFTARARAFLEEAHAPWVEKPIPMAKLLAAIVAVAGEPSRDGGPGGA